MKKIEIQKFGPPQIAARCVEAAEPKSPSPWEATIKVVAFPINPADLAMIAGSYGSLPKLPSGIGMEASGVIEAVGEKVTGLSVGDLVMCVGNNNWAQKTNLPATTIFKLPETADPVQGSMLKVNPSTAKLLLDSVLQGGENQWVVQNAPLGGVGRAVIQIAKVLGLKTINLVRRESAIEEVKMIGGDLAFLSDGDLESKVKDHLGHQRVKFAFDAIGGTETNQLASCLGTGGTILNYGMLSGEPCQVDSSHCIFRRISLQGFWLSKKLNSMTHVERSEMFQWLSELLLTQKLNYPVDSTFPITKISDAISRCESSERNGKVIVLPNGRIGGNE